MKFRVFLPLVAVLLGACTNQQLYSSTQLWRNNQCLRVQDTDARSRCEASARTSYDNYNEARSSATTR